MDSDPKFTVFILGITNSHQMILQIAALTLEIMIFLSEEQDSLLKESRHNI